MFFMSTLSVDCKNMKKHFFFTMSFFKIHFIHFEMHMDRQDKSENIAAAVMQQCVIIESGGDSWRRCTIFCMSSPAI